jgi:hypothetical protein
LPMMMVPLAAAGAVPSIGSIQLLSATPASPPPQMLAPNQAIAPSTLCVYNVCPLHILAWCLSFFSCCLIPRTCCLAPLAAPARSTLAGFADAVLRRGCLSACGIDH